MLAKRGPKHPMNAGDESMVSDIQIGVDGRVHLFGASREILEVLAVIGVRGDAVRQRLARSLAGMREPPAERLGNDRDDQPMSPTIDNRGM